MELPIYAINFDETKFESGIDLIAVTETPAIEEISMRFSKDKVFKFSYDAEKRIVFGPAIIPNKPIYRNDNGKEYYVVFTEETIEKMVEKFNNEQRSIKFNVEHNENKLIEGFIKESWIIEDPEKDKSALYGFNLPKGTWMISAKFAEDVWENVIKNMEQVGFSIEGLMGIQKFTQSEEISSDAINQNKIEKMSKENKTKKLKFVAKRISTKKKFNVSTKKFEEILVTAEEDEVLIVPELAEGAVVEVLDETGTVVAAEDGTFEIPSEEVVVEVADGEIVAIDAAPAAEAPAEEEAMKKNKMEEMPEEKKEEEVKMEVDPETLAKIVELESRLEALEAKLAEGEVIEETFKKTTKFSKDASKAERLSVLRNLVK
jgi:hypothetical protein